MKNVKITRHKKIQPKKGERFGMLTTIMEVGRKRKPNGASVRVFLCQCDCGNKYKADISNLRQGMVKSCGCWKHGRCSSLEYKSWSQMKYRCFNSKSNSYKNYGERGITVCERWMDFKNFYKDMGERSAKQYSLDRIDNSKGYSPENCRWATRKEQGRNTRANRFITHKGVTRCIAEWAELLGLNQITLYYRIKRGMSIDRALSSKYYVTRKV